MTTSGRKGFKTLPISPDDVQSGFCCGVHALDDFFARHAFTNDNVGLGKTFVLHPERETTGLPAVLGFYTLSMAEIEGTRLPSSPGHPPSGNATSGTTPSESDIAPASGTDPVDVGGSGGCMAGSNSSGLVATVLLACMACLVFARRRRFGQK